MSSSETPLRRIKAVNVRPGYRLSIAWDKGGSEVVDLSDMISAGGVFADLADEKRFSAVRVGENNRVIEWPEPKDDLGYPVIEIDADSLHEKFARQRDAHMASTMRELVDAARRIAPPLSRR